MSKFFWFVFSLVLLSATPIQYSQNRAAIIVWNVGQGQWVSVINSTTCFHFDAGGEFFPWRKLKSLCSKKMNQFSLSHWDSDHINGLQSWPRSWQTCIAIRPLGKSSRKKTLLMEQFPDCSPEADILKKTKRWQPLPITQDTNSNSHIVKFEELLLPGDSPQKQEKVWAHLPWIQSSRILILGHHGSKTSTSRELLERLPMLRMAISSARWARYKHPHPATLALLKRHHIPTLRTEDWGNLWFER